MFERHIMSGVLSLDLPAAGGKATHAVEVHGLGLVVNRSVAMGSKSFWTTYTPVDEHFVEVDFAMLATLRTPADPTGELADKSRQVTLREFEKDIPIWENKIYRAHPLVCPGDGPISRFRGWARQFYPRSAGEPSI
jgi:3-ketosteroid 9alpha-monooxygenase subunit A